jgi:PEP-CTERM motif
MTFRSFLQFGAAIVAALASVPVASSADVIYSNLGAGNSYVCCTGETISGPSSFSGFYSAQGNGFTSPGTYNVTQIDVALTNASGTNEADVSLWTSVGGLPGAILGNWIVTNQPYFASTSNTLTTISGITGITLTSGDNYYVIAAPIASDTLDAFNFNNTGALGPIVADSGSGFTGGLCCGVIAAFDVLGVVPEPSTFAILGAGLASLGLIRRRKPCCQQA